MTSFSKPNYSQTLLSASIIIAVTSLLSRLFGLFRDRLLAGTFGAGDTLDVYYTSFRIPDFIFNLLILGALNSAFIPVFKDYLSRHQNKQAYQTASILFNVILIVTIIASAIIYFTANQVTALIAPGFSAEKLQITANLTRIMMLSPLFFGLSSISGGILNSFKRFISYSLAPIFYNLGIIFGILFLVPKFGVYGLSYGVIIGAALNFFIQLPEIFFTGFRYQPIINLNHPGFKKVVSLMIPTTISLAITQINLTVDNIIGSTLKSGSIAVFNLANNIQSLPVGIFAISICTAVFPNLVEFASKKQHSHLTEQVSRSAKQILYVIIPTTIFLYIYRAQIVRLLYGTGAFGWQDTSLTLSTLGFFAFSLPFQSLTPLIVRSFYATHNTSKPLISSFAGMLSNVIFSLILSRYFGVAGLALSFTIATIINFSVITILAYKHIPHFNLELNSTFIKIVSSSIFAGLISYLFLHILETAFDNTTFIGLFNQTACSSIIGVALYIFLSYILKIKELNSLLRIFGLQKILK